jgi:ribosomal protein L7/L12
MDPNEPIPGAGKNPLTDAGQMEELLSSVRGLLLENKKEEAIQLFHERAGVSLEQARDTVEAVIPEFLAEVKMLADQGEKLRAIKLFRERTGSGLIAAGLFVEAIQRNDVQISVGDMSVVDTKLADEVKSLLEKGQAIEAIKLYRTQTGASLSDAKQAIDAVKNLKPDEWSQQALRLFSSSKPAAKPGISFKFQWGAKADPGRMAEDLAASAAEPGSELRECPQCGARLAGEETQCTACGWTRNSSGAFLFRLILGAGLITARVAGAVFALGRLK